MRRLTQWLDDHVHPIALKELRQATQGRFLSGLLLLQLLVQLGFVVGFLLTTEIDETMFVHGGHGETVFAILIVSLLLMGGFGLPIYAGYRFIGERGGEALALLFISNLTAGRIIGGKIISNAVLAGLMISLCLPYMAFTYFLRGIDLLTMGQALLLTATSILCALVFAIFVAAIPSRGMARVLLLGGALVALIWWVTMSVVLVVQVTEDAGRMVRTGGGGWLVVGELTCALLVGLFYLLAVAVISPAVSNRARPVRLYLSVLWLLAGLTATWLWHRHGWEDMIWIWLTFTTLTVCGAALLATVAPDTFSRRLRGELPTVPWRRAVAFLFTSGSANGILWSTLMFAATLGWIALADLGPVAGRREALWQGAGAGGFMLAYSLLAIRLQRGVLASKLARHQTWALVLIAVALGGLLPPAVLFLFSFGRATPLFDGGAWGLLSPFGVGHPVLGGLSSGLGILLAWLMLLWQLPWIRQQVREFRPLEIQPAAPDDGVPS